MTSPVTPKRKMPIGKKMLLWTRTLHIYLSTLALLLVLFFAMTGFMMNHPDWFKAHDVDSSEEKTVPENVLKRDADAMPDRAAIVKFLRTQCGIKGELDDTEIKKEDDPIHLTFKGPAYRYEIDISKADGKTTIAKTKNGLVTFLSNLHKGDDTGHAWKRVIDTTSILLMLISLTGLILWISLSKRRTLGLISLAVCIIGVLGVFFMLVP